MTSSRTRPILDATGRFTARAAAQIEEARHVSLFLDFDGTLAPIRRSPSAASLPRSTAGLLRALAHHPSVSVSIVTGRSLRDIRRRVRDRKVAYAANHGLHIIDTAGVEWIHPGALRARKRLRAMGLVLSERIAAYAGAFVEDKDLTVAVHFRRVRSHRVRGLRSLVNRILRASPNHFRVVTGKKIIEVRPPVDWGKGNAVARLLKGHRGGSRRLVVFIGDDRTDEDAFAILRSRSITIRVGDVHNTSAQYTVRSTTEVRQVLRLLLRSFLQRTRGRA